MAKIVDILYSPGRTGFYFDDQAAIKKGATNDGMFYQGEPVTLGFKEIREAGESISVQIILEDGQVAFGDCAAVQYSGAGGRDPLFKAAEFIPLLEKEITPLLLGKEVKSFRDLAEMVDRHVTADGKHLHTAIRYGVTQAILDAAAKVQKCTMAEVIQKDYQVNDVKISKRPIFAQSGDDRYINADKAIIKRADVLPHALINHVEKKLGLQGEILVEYVAWLRDRVKTKRVSEDYNPIFHIDVYGTIGVAFNYDLDAIYNYLVKLTETAAPFRLRIEGVVDCGNKIETLNIFAKLTRKLDMNKIKCELVADEWCNTLEDIKDFADAKAGHVLQIKTPDLGGVNNIAEAIIYCNQKGVGSYSGGTCNETNRSAEVTTNIAMACGALQVLAKPGMGVDEGFMIVFNEMERVMARVNRRK